MSEQAKELVMQAWNGTGESWEQRGGSEIDTEKAIQCFERRVEMLWIVRAYRSPKEQEWFVRGLDAIRGDVSYKFASAYATPTGERKERIDFMLFEQKAQAQAANVAAELPIEQPSERLYTSRVEAIQKIFLYFHVLTAVPSGANQATLQRLTGLPLNNLVVEVERLTTKTATGHEHPDLSNRKYSFCLACIAADRGRQITTLLQVGKTPDLKRMLYEVNTSVKDLRSLKREDPTININDTTAFSKQMMTDIIRLTSLEGKENLAPLVADILYYPTGANRWLLPTLFAHTVKKGDSHLAEAIHRFISLNGSSQSKDYRSLYIDALVEAQRGMRRLGASYRSYDPHDTSRAADYWRQVLKDDPLALIEARVRIAATAEGEHAPAVIDSEEREWFSWYEKTLNLEFTAPDVWRTRVQDLAHCHAQIQLARARVDPQHVNFAQGKLLLQKYVNKKICTPEDLDTSKERLEAALILSNHAKAMKSKS